MLPVLGFNLFTSSFFSVAGHAGESAPAAASPCASDSSPTHEARETPSNSSGRILNPLKHVKLNKTL